MSPKATKAKTKVSPMSIKNAEGMPVLGWLVSWSTKDFIIRRDELVKLLDKVGIDEKVAREVIPKNAAIRAVREFGKGAKTFHKKVADTKDTTALVIAGTQVDDAFNAKFDTESKVLFEKDTRTLKIEGSRKNEIEEAFKRNQQVYAGDQFRSIVLRYVKRECDAITYLETGNVYFIPAFRKDAFDRIVALFGLLKAKGAAIHIKEEIDTKQVRGVMWDITVGEIKHQITKLKDDFESVAEKANSEDGAKASSVALRLKKYKLLRDKVAAYESALQGKASELKRELDGLTTKMQTVLTEVE